MESKIPLLSVISRQKVLIFIIHSYKYITRKIDNYQKLIDLYQFLIIFAIKLKSY
jgi:hypothetical protein